MELGLVFKVFFVGSIVECEILKCYYVVVDLFLFFFLYDNVLLVICEVVVLGIFLVLIRDFIVLEIIFDLVNGFLSFNSIEVYFNCICEILCSIVIIK